MPRGQVIRVLVGVVAVTALAAAVAVAVAGDDDGNRVQRLRSGAAAPSLGSQADELVDATTTSMTLAPEATTTTASSLAPSPTTTARPTTAPRAAPATTTTSAPAPPSPVLDPGELECGAPPEGGLIRGDVVAVAMPDGIHELSLDGERDVVLPGVPRGEGGLFSSMAWSADGRRLAYISASPTRQSVHRYPLRDLTVVDLATSCRRLLTRSGADAFASPSWAPDGERLAYNRQIGGEPCCAPKATLETARADGTDVRRLATSVIGGSWAPDGSGRIAFGHEGRMSVVDREGRITTIDTNAGGAEIEAWSPDATRVVYTVSVNQAVWVAQADGAGVRRLTPNPSNNVWTSRFSPDGKRIVFNWRDELWVTDVDGGNQRRLVEKASTAGGWWTPRGDAIVYSGEGGTFVLPVDGDAAPRLLTARGSVVSVFRRAS